jgi:hypothetical protein
VLEGERVDVACVYARIKRDPRHKDLALIVTGPIDARQFPEWSMADDRNPPRKPCSVSPAICLPPTPQKLPVGLSAL